MLLQVWREKSCIKDLDAKSFIIDYSFLLQLHSFSKVAEKEKKINTYEKHN